MIFATQRLVEDYLQRRRIDDIDQYAIKVANRIAGSSAPRGEGDILKSLANIRTGLFRRNRHIDRGQFEIALAKVLWKSVKKNQDSSPSTVHRVVLDRGRRLKKRESRITIKKLLEGYKSAIESRGVDAFWISRKSGRLKQQPESIAQALLAVFAKGVMSNNGRGLVLRELMSGTGFVDIGIVLGAVLHIVELKILNGALVGPAQLGKYMRFESRSVGWLVLFDARKGSRASIPRAIKLPRGVVRVVVVEVNPGAPSQAK